MDPATYLPHARALFGLIQGRADRALAQTADRAFFTQIDPESNSLAHLVKHLAGNARSRFTDFLTTDGEKPDRLRDEEFEVRPDDTRDALMAAWEAGWATLFATLDALVPDDLFREVRIRGEPHTVFGAIERQKEHYAYHVGQIVFLAKHLAGRTWAPLSIPRGGSAAYDARSRARWEGERPSRGPRGG